MIDSYPSSNTSSFLTLNPADGLNADLPGPSSTYIPREASPLLPDLRRASEDSDDSDDEVLTQLPIYLSPSLHPNLHLLQYPLNHRSLSVPTWAMDRGKHISARVKEGVGRVEVEIPVDAGADVWREDRARDLGFVLDVDAVNGTRKGEEVEGGYGFGGRGAVTGTEKEKEKKKKRRKEEKWGDKVRLRSEVVPNATGYYSGIIHDGESLLLSVRRIESDEVVGALHLHPISKLLQMRTSLSYLDDHDVRLRERAPLNRERNGDDEEGEKEERRPKANGTAGRRPARPVKVSSTLTSIERRAAAALGGRKQEADDLPAVVVTRRRGE